jgi:hypothetical protein
MRSPSSVWRKHSQGTPGHPIQGTNGVEVSLILVAVLVGKVHHVVSRVNFLGHIRPEIGWARPDRQRAA